MSGCLVRVRGRTSFRRRWKKRVKIGGDGKEAEENDQQQELDEEEEKEEGESVKKDDKFFESFEKSDSTFLRRPKWKEIRKKGQKDEGGGWSFGGSFAQLFLRNPSNHHILVALSQMRLHFET